MNRRQPLLSRLRSKWEDLLTIEPALSEPGFIGPIPYLLSLRWLIVGGSALRFLSHRNEYTGSQWSLVLSSIGVTAMLALAATYVTTHPNLNRSRRVQGLFIASDILWISFFYFLTNSPQSDFFLFYYLPIFAATEYLGGKVMLTVSAVITGAFASVLVLLLPADPTLTPASLFLRVFLPREVFFLSVVVLSSSLRRFERRQTARLSRRGVEMQTLLDFKTEVDQLFGVDQVLELTLRKAVSSVGAEGGHISLVDYETGQLELKSYTLQDYFVKESILTIGDAIDRQVVQQRRARWLRDVQSDPTLSRIFGPRIHSLLCVPIMAHNTVLGTLSIGSATGDHFGDDTERFLQALAGQVASAIERARLLRSLGEIGATAASALELDIELDAILQELTESLGFEFATISLVDDYRGVVETVRGKNVPPGWIERSRHSLHSPNIQADVVRTGKAEVIEGWDERFDKEIYERFGHENLARIFAPLIADGVIIGTIEAGCRCGRRAEILTPENIQAVERLGQERGKRVARTRSYVLLELIANQAMRFIGADSASIHVYHFDQPLLEAGAGKATKDFLLRFPPKERGIARRAMQTDKPVVIDTQDLAAVNRALYDEGVRAIAAFPLSIGAGVQGVLYVHFWREHRFSLAELELEEVFARQMEVAIQNNLLLKSIAEAAQRAWALSGFQSVVQSLALTSSLNLTRVLEDVAQNVLYMLDADNVTLYQYFQTENRFGTPPVMKGSFWDRGSIQTRRYPDSIVWKIVQDRGSRFISDVSREPMLAGARSDGVDRPRFIEREGITSSAAVVLRVGEMDEIVGLMFVNYRTPHDFSAEDQKTINALASSAAIAIKTARLYERVSQDLKRRDKELEALRVIDKAIAAGARAPDIQPVLELILDKAMEIVKAPVGDVAWFNRWEGVLELRAGRGFSEAQRTVRQKLGEGIIGLAAERRESIMVSDVTTAEWAQVYEQVTPNIRSELAVPLVDESGLLGVLNMEHPEAGAFSQNDRALLETLAVQAVIAIHSVELYQKTERQIKSLRALSTIASRIQNVRYTLDTVLRLLLTGVTTGEGLGFSRAMLFLTDDTGTKLQGKMALGAQTRQEAAAIWERLDKEACDLRARGEDLLMSLLDQAEEFSIAVKERGKSDCPLSTAIQSVCIPVEEGTGAPSACVLGGKPVIVKDAQPDPFRKIIELVTKLGDMGRAFACVPLIGKGGPIGALVVDNRFLVSEREIDEGAIDSLEAFAGVMAMSIENIWLQAQLAEEQRLATWRELTARIAHTIGTRIAVIEGSVTQLRSRLLEEGEIQGKLAEETRAYLEDLTSGIRKAKMTLKGFREFAAPLQFRIEELDLAQVLTATIRGIQHGLNLPIELILPSEPLTVYGDPLRLSDVFIELVRNAQEAMQQDTGRAPRIKITASMETSPVIPEGVARIEFADTGPGISEADKKRLFEPFFTTRSRGSGLGLAIVKAIIEQHEGTIEEVGTSGEGAKFIVRLPITQ